MTQKNSSPLKLLTFYKFVHITDPHEQVAAHKQFCTDIGMKGRIYLGEEGISATATCNEWQYQAYMLFLNANPYFQTIADLHEKITYVDDHQFEKMIVKYRPEIVALGKTVTAEQVAASDKQLSVEEFKKILDTEDPNRTILDMRNDYEWQLGHFRNALPAGTVTFKEVQDLIKKYKAKLQDKNVVMYCTWWIRCEKLSVMLKKEGVENFYALNGGVVKYTNMFDDGNWEGNLYTFDGRVSCPIGTQETHTSIATCIYTGIATDTSENCRYSPCNARITADPKAYRKHMGFCSTECAHNAQQDLLIKNVDRDPIDYKSLRGIIKQDPTQKEAIFYKIKQYITKKLLHASSFPTTPQKEKVLYHR